jgi:urease subunit beta
MIPGEIIVSNNAIEINQGRKYVTLKVSNNGDRPIQVGSHYHFFEVNNSLEFTRNLGYGFRLNIPAGTAIRFEPGQTKEVELVQYQGLRQIFGFQNLINGQLKGEK